MDNKILSIAFFEDYFVCGMMPNGYDFEFLQINEIYKIPLFFYVENNKVIQNDTTAKDIFRSGADIAFGDFYNTILTNRVYEIYSDIKKPVDLLDDIINKIKTSYFFANNAEPASNLKIPYLISFCIHINNKASDKIINKFNEHGFQNIGKINNSDALLYGLIHEQRLNECGVCSIIEAENNDLNFCLFEYSRSDINELKQKETYKDKGINLSIRALARLMVEKAVTESYNPIASDENKMKSEINQHLKKAEKELGNFKNNSEISTTITLSDHTECRIIITKPELDNITRREENLGFILYSFEKYIAEHKNRLDKIIIKGQALNNEIFVNELKKTCNRDILLLSDDEIYAVVCKGGLFKEITKRKTEKDLQAEEQKKKIIEENLKKTGLLKKEITKFKDDLAKIALPQDEEILKLKLQVEEKIKTIEETIATDITAINIEKLTGEFDKIKGQKNKLLELIQKFNRKIEEKVNQTKEFLERKKNDFENLSSVDGEKANLLRKEFQKVCEQLEQLLNKNIFEIKINQIEDLKSKLNNTYNNYLKYIINEKKGKQKKKTALYTGIGIALIILISGTVYITTKIINDKNLRNQPEKIIARIENKGGSGQNINHQIINKVPKKNKKNIKEPVKIENTNHETNTGLKPEINENTSDTEFLNIIADSNFSFDNRKEVIRQFASKFSNEGQVITETNGVITDTYTVSEYLNRIMILEIRSVNIKEIKRDQNNKITLLKLEENP